MNSQTEAVAAFPASIKWTADMPVFLRHSALYGDNLISRFSDDSWTLREAASKATVTKRTLSFANVSSTFRDSVKRIAWCMLNVEAPVEFVSRSSAMRTRLSVGSAVSNIEAEIRPFIKWVELQNISCLSDLTEETLRDYGDYVSSSSDTRSYKARRLWGATRFWVYSRYLPPEDRILQPPWDREGADELLGSANWRRENKTPPIHPTTMSLLLYWAMKIVDDLSGTFMEALMEKEDLLTRLRNNSIDGDRERLSLYLAQKTTDGAGIPGFVGKTGLVAGRQYIAAMSGVGINCVAGFLSEAKELSYFVREGCPLKTKPKLYINGRPAFDSFDFYGLNKIKEVTSTACLIVIAYLSGMRSEECRALRRGSCVQIRTEDGSYRYEIHSYSFKDAIDVNGNAIVGGRKRSQPWHAIGPVAKAIRVMEKLHDQDYLFSKNALQDFANANNNLVLDSVDISRRISNFISWCNEISINVKSSELIIPQDPDGRVTMNRFRRTLAWFIYRLPGGRISVGIQFGHLESLTTDGYGSRTSTGLRNVFPVEEALARAEALLAASERLAGGEGVSGPAAQRYISGVFAFMSEYGGRFLTHRQFSQLLRTPNYRIYDNGAQPVACCYDPIQALCHPDLHGNDDLNSTPNLSRCVSRCPNVARTDTHIASIKEEINMLRANAQSQLSPEPIRIRCLQRVETLEAIITKHLKTRVTM